MDIKDKRIGSWGRSQVEFWLHYVLDKGKFLNLSDFLFSDLKSRANKYYTFQGWGENYSNQCI